jgi:hypothetical protein
MTLDHFVMVRIHARQPIITSTALVFYKSELLNPDSPVAYCRDAGFRAHFMFCILYDMKITIDKEVIYISKGVTSFLPPPVLRGGFSTR